MRKALTALFMVAATIQIGAQAPADRWPQFRGSANLVGTTAATLPVQLKVQWTYEAGDAIESSAAIAELHAVNLADGKAKWKYKAADDGIGESSPAVAGGIVYIGDLSGMFHAVDINTGKAAWTFKTGSEIKSSHVV